MENYSALITVIIFTLLTIIGIGYWLWNRGRIGRICVIALLCYLSFSAYRAFYPADSFYKAEFERITNIKFPESGYFIVQDSSYPDIHGDYSYCALVAVSSADYASLQKQMTNNPDTQTGRAPYPCQSRSDKDVLLSHYRYVVIGDSDGEHYEWGLLNNQQLYYYFGSQ